MFSGADPGFQVRGGAHLIKLRRAKGGANIFGVFRVKNQDFTPKNHIFSNFRGGGGGARRVPPLVLYVYALSVCNDLSPNAWTKCNALVDTNAFWDIHKQICHHWQKQMNTEKPRNGNINVIKHTIPKICEFLKWRIDHLHISEFDSKIILFIGVTSLSGDTNFSVLTTFYYKFILCCFAGFKYL